MENDSVNPSAERPTAFPWPPVLLVGAALAAVLLGRFAPLAWPGVNDQPAHVFGIGIGAAGIALFVWAAMTLRRHRTTIIPNQGATTLVTDGPYRWRRHPIYIADVLIMLGAAELTQNIWFAIMALVFAGLVTWLAAIPEERHLEARFGDAYRAYKAKTRMWL